MVLGVNKTSSQSIKLNVWALVGGCLGQPKQFQLLKSKSKVASSVCHLIGHRFRFLYEMVIARTFVGFWLMYTTIAGGS